MMVFQVFYDGNYGICGRKEIGEYLRTRRRV